MSGFQGNSNYNYFYGSSVGFSNTTTTTTTTTTAAATNSTTSNATSSSSGIATERIAIGGDRNSGNNSIDGSGVRGIVNESFGFGSDCNNACLHALLTTPQMHPQDTNSTTCSPPATFAVPLHPVRAAATAKRHANASGGAVSMSRVPSRQQPCGGDGVALPTNMVPPAKVHRPLSDEEVQWAFEGVTDLRYFSDPEFQRFSLHFCLIIILAGDKTMDDEIFEGAVDPRRVWLANLPTKSTEFAVLQLVRPFGKILDFNFPVHQAGGPLQGSTLGYCFVTFAEEKCALKAMESLNGRPFYGSVLSAQRARPTREALAQWWEAREEAQRARIEADRQRREEELARRLTETSSTLLTTTASFADGDDGSRRETDAVSAKSIAQPPSPPKVSYAQNRQAIRRIEAALRSTSQIAVQPAALRTEEERRRQQPHPIVAALLAGNKQQPMVGDRRPRGRRGGTGAHRYNPYLRS
ncbi:putative RNA-binding protein 18 [Taenia crassiceps]|uniref:RNA-binding protein 18 n=1 Tax=Taenia crassiceps TaxID=6207 RepID=A0ABR4Q093_9CEST